jgi:hypothetical protein
MARLLHGGAVYGSEAKLTSDAEVSMPRSGCNNREHRWLEKGPGRGQYKFHNCLLAAFSPFSHRYYTKHRLKYRKLYHTNTSFRCMGPTAIETNFTSF